MSTIKIKRSSTNGAPGSLEAGEIAYSFLAGNLSNGGDRLYFGTGSAVDVIGGKYFTEKLDHALGTLTASSAILVDSNSKIDNLKVDNLDLNGNTISTTDLNGNLSLTPNGTGVVVASKLEVSDLTSTRITFAGANGRLTDSTSLTFNSGTGTLTVVGDATVDNVNINGNTISTTNTNGNLSLTPNGTGVVVAAKLEVSDLTATRVAYVGASGRLVDSANMTFTTATGALSITGELTVDNLNLNGSTVTGSVVNGNIIFLPNGTGVLSVSGTTDYELNLTDDDDIPNKKYVDSAITALNASASMDLTGDNTTSAEITFNSEVLAFRSGANDGLTVEVSQGTGGDAANVFVTVNLDQALATTSSPQFNNLTLTGDLAVNGADITTTASTFNLLNATATTINFGGGASTISIGALTSTVTFNDDVVITGDLTVNGDMVTVNTTNLSVEDPLIRMAIGNTTTDSLDIGFIGSYGDTGEKYTGFFRDATNDEYYVFNGAPTSALANNVIDRNAVGFTLAKINASEFVGNIDGGTY
jgi:hypothetical protein